MPATGDVSYHISLLPVHSEAMSQFIWSFRNVLRKK